MEIAEEKRKRQMAIIKASNEMLEEAKKTALEKNTDPIKRAELEAEFDKAIEENITKAKTYLQADESEIESSTYRDADKVYVEKYEKRLKAKGLSDEELHRKGEATVSIGSESGIPKKRRTRKTEKSINETKDLDITRIVDEEKMMQETRVTSDKQVTENIQKNKELENKELKVETDKVEQLNKTFEKTVAQQKVNVVPESEKQPVSVTLEEHNNDGFNTKPSKKKKKPDGGYVEYTFDVSSVPSYVQYDVIPLPSNGEPYPIDSPLRCGRIPVAYLTASDENLIASPNMYRDGKLLDIILGRKILDKRINVDDLVTGDRDAIILWLRGTSYGETFPIVATNPDTNKEYNIVVNLSQFKYNDFNLTSDNDGNFTFTCDNGDEVKFNYFTKKDEDKLRDTITKQLADSNRFDILTKLSDIRSIMTEMEIGEEDSQNINEDLEEMTLIFSEGLNKEINSETIPTTITEQMVLHTKSVNGNTDKEYIRGYVENMRTKNALAYRNYFMDNQPGVDFKITVNIPESDGGGSFDTFLRVNDTIFLNF